MRILSREEKKELKISANPLRKLRVDLWSQGMTLESFLEVCYNCNLNPLPTLRAKGINIKYFKNPSYCDVSVHHEGDRVVLSYPDFESDWNMWCRFNDRYHDLLNLAEERKIQKRGLNRPHRVVRKCGIN